MAYNNKIIIPGSQRGKVIEVGTMSIKGHMLHLPDIAIQISNISGIAVSEVQWLNPGIFLVLVGLCTSVAGGIFMKMSWNYDSWYGYYYDENMRTISICLLVAGGLLLVVGGVIWKKAKLKCLNIYLNGGITHSIYFSSQSFMTEILNRLSAIFENGGIVTQEFSISIGNCSVLNSSVVNPGTINNSR